MTTRNTQFGIAIAIVLATLGWLAVSGVQESKTYYVTVKELNVMKDHERVRRLRVAGSVAPGSIRREGRQVHFILVEEGQTVAVVYVGSSPLPDTFVENSQALADGILNRESVFEAYQIQAKCASKYEAKPGQTSKTS